MRNTRFVFFFLLVVYYFLLFTDQAFNTTQIEWLVSAVQWDQIRLLLCEKGFSYQLWFLESRVSILNVLVMHKLGSVRTILKTFLHKSIFYECSFIAFIIQGEVKDVRSTVRLLTYHF